MARTLERIEREVDAKVADRLSDTVRRVFGKVLRELADLDNPMRSAIGTEPGEGGLLVPALSPADRDRDGGRSATPSLSDLASGLDGADPVDVQAAPGPSARPDRSRSGGLPTVIPDPTPGPDRSRFDPDAGVVLYNDQHPDYLMVKDDEAGLLDYLATLVAKEYVVYNNPRSSAPELAEEMVRMLVRVRRHLPRRR